MNEEHISKDDYLKALELLHEKGSDGFGELSSYVLSALGAAGAYSVAPAIATLIGAVTTTSTVTAGTVLGSATLASWLGVAGTVATVSTPVGWVIGGITVAGAITTYGIAKLCIKAGRENAKRDRYKEDLRKKIVGYMAAPQKNNDKVKMVADALITAYKQGKVSKEDGSRLVMLLKDEKITPEAALSTLFKMVTGK